MAFREWLIAGVAVTIVLLFFSTQTNMVFNSPVVVKSTITEETGTTACGHTDFVKPDSRCNPAELVTPSDRLWHPGSDPYYTPVWDVPEYSIPCSTKHTSDGQPISDDQVKNLSIYANCKEAARKRTQNDADSCKLRSTAKCVQDLLGAWNAVTCASAPSACSTMAQTCHKVPEVNMIWNQACLPNDLSISFINEQGYLYFKNNGNNQCVWECRIYTGIGDYVLNPPGVNVGCSACASF